MNGLNGNWVDLVIIAVLLYFASEALWLGFWVILADFLSFVLSLLIALRGYTFASRLLESNFNLTPSLSHALGFLLTAVIVETIITLFFNQILKRIPSKLWKLPLLKPLAIIPSVGEGLILISFVLTLIIALPIAPALKSAVLESRMGGNLVAKTAGAETKLKEVFGGVIEESLTYLTIKPESDESVQLRIATKNLRTDEVSEKAMLSLVNEERAKEGVAALAWASNIVPVSRAHATDMWQREYFAHISPDGEDVGDRLDGSGVDYRIAGENLALAPTLDTAHNGLMNSPGHRRNILDPQFKKVGIGVIDNGIYGKMFVQVFTD